MESMDNFQLKVNNIILWLIQFKIFKKIFIWIAADEKNNYKFLLCFNIFNTSLYLTAAISPWIFITWGIIIPFLLFRVNPWAAVSSLINLARNKEIKFIEFMITMFFLMLFYICLFSCLFMVFG